ncbi:hypothetical protein IC575_023407 [Cucumis melo]|uniref:Transcription termination factor MTEF1, chloroplastic n=1 Tax=Cucumis melo TaxID=3656 RepID=A0A1S3BFK9_CUCME|nr:transcription termination factor MTEF1, chloroplastic [Cucumis melo]
MISRLQLPPPSCFIFFFPPSLAGSLKPLKNPSFGKPRFTLSLNTQFSDRSDSGLLFREKILYLENHLNVDSRKAFRENPHCRSASLSTLKSVEVCLSSMGLDRSAVGRVLDMYPKLLTSNPDYDIYPIFDFLLNEVQIPFPDIHKSIIRCPRILVSDLDHQLRPALKFLRDLGFVGLKAITCQTTLLLVSNVEHTLLPKIQFLENLGLSHEDVVNMVLRSPGLLTYSIQNNLVPKVNYFLGDMKGDLLELKSFPQYFSFNLERKIKPRHRSLVEHGLSLPLSKMLKVSDGEFNAWLTEMRCRSLMADR